MRIDVSKEDRNAIDNARDALHRVVLDVLKHHPDIETWSLDLSEIGESIALEGYFEV